MDNDSQRFVAPNQIVNDSSYLTKSVSETNRNLGIVWRPRAKSSDYDYNKVRPMRLVADGAANPAVNALDTPLAYIKVLQHGIDIGAEKPGCCMEIKLVVACKGLVNAQGDKLSDAQKVLKLLI